MLLFPRPLPDLFSHLFLVKNNYIMYATLSQLLPVVHLPACLSIHCSPWKRLPGSGWNTCKTGWGGENVLLAQRVRIRRYSLQRNAQLSSSSFSLAGLVTIDTTTRTSRYYCTMRAAGGRTEWDRSEYKESSKILRRNGCILLPRRRLSNNSSSAAHGPVVVFCSRHTTNYCMIVQPDMEPVHCAYSEYSGAAQNAITIGQPRVWYFIPYLAF